MIERWVVLLAGVVGAVPFYVTGHRGFAVLAVCAGIFFAGKVAGSGLDPVRLFSDEDRRTIFERAGGRCEQPGCGVPVHYEGDCPLGGCDWDFQADHVIAWSKGGRTVLSNGACLCAYHNRVKSDN